MTMIELRDTLLTITESIFHYKPLKPGNKYIVWSEITQSGAKHADNKATHQAIRCAVHFFTKDEFDHDFFRIQRKFNDAEIPWRLNSVQYEEDTGFIHYEWYVDVDYEWGEDDGQDCF